MVTKRTSETENLRKRKRIIPTRAAGTPVNTAFENPADELFAEVFANRSQTSELSEFLPNDVQLPDSISLQELGQVQSGKVRSSMVKSGKVRSSTVESDKNVLNHLDKIRGEISPSKNFTKFTNSLLEDAIPEKLFRGQSKHTYDVLYKQTRGAIKPVRQIQLTKTELMKLTGLSDKTVQTHIRNLKEIGLVIIYPLYGSHQGWMYEILVPQEVKNISMVKSGKVESSMVKSGKNLTSLTGKNLTLLDHTNTIENKDTYGDAKTYTKTSTNDDDTALTEFAKKFSEVSKKLTGRGLSKKESLSWEQLADLLILELEKAAKNTNSISSVPAFLTEVLRRRFFTSNQAEPKISRSNIKRSNQSKPDLIGKPPEESFEIKPLDHTGREEALRQIQDFAEDDFLESFEKWYTKEDWQWLIEQLDKN